MHITILGMALLPLAILWALQPTRLLELALVVAIFEAGAALVLGGSFGLPLAMVPGLIFILYFVAQYALGMRFPGEKAAIWTLTPLIVLLCYAVFSIIVLPDAFAGQIMVAPQKPDPLGPTLTPLAFNSGNVTQTLYLAMNVITAVCAAIYLTRARISYRRIIGAYLLGGYIVVGLAFWQFANRVAGVPFPDEVLYSNPSWAIVDQRFGSVPRIQGPFSEPAGLAFYLSGLCFCCLWLTAKGHRLMRVNLLLALSILAMLISTSTTGIAVLAIGLPAIVVFTVLRGDSRSLARLGKTSVLIAFAGCIVLGPVFVMEPTLLKSVSEVVEATQSKGDSESYDQRTAVDDAGLATLGQTYGLGVGWGGFRTSSLLPGLVANGGVVAIAAVLWLILRIVRSVRRTRQISSAHPGRVLVDGFSAALCGQLAAALLSAPTIGSLAFFLELGCIAGTTGRMVIDARPVAMRARPASFAAGVRPGRRTLAA